MTNDKNDVYVKFAKNIQIALVCDGDQHSFQGMSETCVCGKEKANITRIEENEKEIESKSAPSKEEYAPSSEPKIDLITLFENCKCTKEKVLPTCDVHGLDEHKSELATTILKDLVMKTVKVDK